MFIKSKLSLISGRGKKPIAFDLVILILKNKIRQVHKNLQGCSSLYSLQLQNKNGLNYLKNKRMVKFRDISLKDITY